MVEGETKGFLDLITIDGDNARSSHKGRLRRAGVACPGGRPIYVLDVP